MSRQTTTETGDPSLGCMQLREIRTELEEISRRLSAPADLLHPNDDEQAALNYAHIQRLADEVAKRAALALVEWKSELSERVRNGVSDRITAELSKKK